VPLLLLFSGTVFSVVDGKMSVAQVPWSKEASYRLPVSTWREAIDAHFPNTAWIKVGSLTFDDLLRYKSQKGLATWEAVILDLLSQAADRAEGPV
jgi:hypothetical protein